MMGSRAGVACQLLGVLALAWTGDAASTQAQPAAQSCSGTGAAGVSGNVAARSGSGGAAVSCVAGTTAPAAGQPPTPALGATTPAADGGSAVTAQNNVAGSPGRVAAVLKDTAGCSATGRTAGDAGWLAVLAALALRSRRRAPARAARGR